MAVYGQRGAGQMEPRGAERCIVVLAFVLKKISDRIAERREEQEEWEEERRSRAFAAWIRTGSLKG